VSFTLQVFSSSRWTKHSKHLFTWKGSSFSTGNESRKAHHRFMYFPLSFIITNQINSSPSCTQLLTKPSYSRFLHCGASKSFYILTVCSYSSWAPPTTPLILCPTLHLSRATMVSTMSLLPSSFFHMLSLFSFLLFSIRYSTAQGPPPPGYYPSSKISSATFDEGFKNLWGPQHQKLDQDSLTIWLDTYTGM